MIWFADIFWYRAVFKPELFLSFWFQSRIFAQLSKTLGHVGLREHSVERQMHWWFYFVFVEKLAGARFSTVQAGWLRMVATKAL